MQFGNHVFLTISRQSISELDLHGSRLWSTMVWIGKKWYVLAGMSTILGLLHKSQIYISWEIFLYLFYDVINYVIVFELELLSELK